MLYASAPFLLLGLAMLTRGWIYTLWPNGKVAEKRKRRNLKVGFTTDMKLFGRRIRRLGLMITLVGAALAGWHFAGAADPPASTTTSPTSPTSPASPASPASSTSPVSPASPASSTSPASSSTPPPVAQPGPPG